MYKLVSVKFMDFIILLHKELYNKKNKEQLKEQIALEAFDRLTLSFYKYIEIDNLESFRNQLYLDWSVLGVLGRVYLASEGINAQVSIPEHNIDSFKVKVCSHKIFKEIMC